MPVIERSALVMHSALQMYDLVNDVDRYQEFLPWCADSITHLHEDQQAVCEITMMFKGMHKSFTTRNDLIHGEQIRMSLVDGPFSHLYGVWNFAALSTDACKIEFKLEFKFSNKLVGSVVGAVFSHIAESMVDSFCKRADHIYNS